MRPKTRHCTLETGPDTALRIFRNLGQRGILVPCGQQIPLLELLQRELQCGKRQTASIETIFINGVARDSLQTPVFPGDTVALSAAMPGLAGAIFRKNSIHRGLRGKPAEPVPAQTQQSISCLRNHEFVTVKLFNTTGAEQIPIFLQKGVLVSTAVLGRFFSRHQDWLRPRVSSILLEDIFCDFDALLARIIQEPDHHIYHVRIRTGTH